MEGKDIISQAITNSAKNRFDYATFSQPFSEPFSEMDKNLAEEILSFIIKELAANTQESAIINAIFNRLLFTLYEGDSNDLKNLVRGKRKLLKSEIFATQIAAEMLDDGIESSIVLSKISPLLNGQIESVKTKLTKKKWLKKIINYPLEEAKSNLETKIIWSDRLYELNEEQESFFAIGITRAIREVTEILIKDENFNQKIYENSDILIRCFTYFFDKAIEIIYNIRVKNERTTTFSLDDLVNGMGGNRVPEYIQLKVTPNIGKIAQIFNATLSFIIKKEKKINKNEISISDLVQCILLSGAKLGNEYCLRLDLDDQSEMENLLNS